MAGVAAASQMAVGGGSAKEAGLDGQVMRAKKPGGIAVKVVNKQARSPAA